MLLGLIATCFFICILKDVKRAVWIGFTVAAAQLILHLQIKFGSDSLVLPLEIALVTALLAMVALSILRRQKWPLFGALFLGACYIICHGLGSIVYAAAWQQIVMQAALYAVFGGLLILQQLYCVRLCLKDAQEPASFLAAPRPELSWQKSSDQEMQRLLIFEHDFRHHLDMVAALYDAGKAEEARAYIEDAKQARLSGQGHRLCSASELSYMLMAKKRQCREAEIFFSYQIVGCPDGIAQLDMAALLFNLIDNAVRACQSIEGTDRSISLMLISRGLLWQVEMRNSGVYDPAAEPQKGHGLGLVSVRQITEKYQGSYEIYQDDDEVVQKIILTEPTTEKG